MFSASRSFVSSLSSSLRPRVLMSTRRLASSPPPPPLPETRFAPKKAIRAMSLSKFVAHQTAFALRLAQRVAAAEANEGANVAFSPLSLHALLSLAAAGTRAPPSTSSSPCSPPRRARGRRAPLTTSPPSPPASSAASSPTPPPAVGPASPSRTGCGSTPPSPSRPRSRRSPPPLTMRRSNPSISKTSEIVDGETSVADSAGEITDQINSWISSATNGLIKSMISSRAINQFTRVVLGNAIYFKGAWADRFDASGTEDGEFHLLNGNSVRVPFMTNPEMQFMSSYDDFKVLRLPYRKGNDRRQFSMYIFLPDDRDGLWSLIDKLSSDPEFLNRHLPKREVKLGEFRIPKFKISCGLDAPRLLEEMGVHLLFCGDGG
uniref:Serpin domain-containing protein n=1 Tax=Ananas comosus var. bracteatus TaxID=296719 RepID=A0A6V7NG36_ANACO|nr:unnamed protein product [Ananas comosus var. bracteatus]